MRTASNEIGLGDFNGKLPHEAKSYRTGLVFVVGISLVGWSALFVLV